MWHACGPYSIESFLRGKAAHGRTLFKAFEALVRQLKPIYAAPAKTRVAFMGRVRFAGVTQVSDQGMTCAFALPYPVKSPRFAKVDLVAHGWWRHEVRITDVGQLDREVLGWLRKSHRLMGMQERLTSSSARGKARASTRRRR